MNTNNAPCPCVTMTRDVSDHIASHHPECPISASLWECEECGARAINGNGRGWSAGNGARLHDCVRTKPGLLARAFRIDLGPAERALVGVVHGMRVWGNDGDGIHTDAWDAYVEACRVLGLPAPKEDAP